MSTKESTHNTDLNILLTGATNGVRKVLAGLLSKRNGITLGIIGRNPNKL